jgi:hypothetical protein
MELRRNEGRPAMNFVPEIISGIVRAPSSVLLFLLPLGGAFSQGVQQLVLTGGLTPLFPNQPEEKPSQVVRMFFHPQTGHGHRNRPFLLAESKDIIIL